MPGGPVVRPYRPEDEGEVLRVWNGALAADPIGAALWRTKVLLDPNFDPATCLVAEADGAARGFLLALARRVPYFNDGLDPESAWITAFGVEPGWQGRGLGARCSTRRWPGCGRTGGRAWRSRPTCRTTSPPAPTSRPTAPASPSWSGAASASSRGRSACAPR